MYVVGRFPFFWIVSVSNDAWRHPTNRTTPILGFTDRMSWSYTRAPEEEEPVAVEPKKRKRKKSV
jgi:hypothetical protein